MFMNSKRRTVMFAVVTGAFSMLACLGLQIGRPTPDRPVTELLTCTSENPSVLCVVSFGLDTNNRMLVNFISPDPSLPSFYLKIQHGETSNRYDCAALKSVPTSVYCTAAPVGLGDSIDIEVYSSKGDTLLAKGTFVIAAFALPTPLVVESTAPSEPTQTPIPGFPTLTPTPTFTLGLPTQTPTITIQATQTPIPYSYP